MIKSLLRKPRVQYVAGWLAARYLQLVFHTGRFVVEPEHPYDRAEADMPLIIAMWHGQHFLVPFIQRPQDQAAVLISRHRDGAVNAVAAEILGIRTIRGSGDPKGRFDKKGGVGAFKALLDALKSGCNVALTADVPKISQVAGLGIITLARYSGRPIYPIGVSTRWRIVFKSWDKASLHLPFSRGAFVLGEPVWVDADASEESCEAARLALQQEMNRVQARAHELARGQP